MLPLTGYTNRLSAVPGETVEFKVSSVADQDYTARLVRVICGDPNPAGPGIKEQDLSSVFAGQYPSCMQSITLGSYGRVNGIALKDISTLTLAATIWPTTPDKGAQVVLVCGSVDSRSSISLVIDEAGSMAAHIVDSFGVTTEISVGKSLRERIWYRVWLSIDKQTKVVSAGQQPLTEAFAVDDASYMQRSIDSVPDISMFDNITIAASDGDSPDHFYNGKIEKPFLMVSEIKQGDITQVFEAQSDDVIAAWDFSKEISSQRIIDTGPNTWHGELINVPARGMTGSNWDGSEMCWRHAPDQYGAIHFHDDDIYDCQWQTDFSFTVPQDLRSGVYAMRLECDGVEEMLPFFVRPACGTTQSKICVLAPTYTYTMYANHARGNTDDEYRARVNAWNARPWTADEHREYGFSTYNFHSDDSGICYASRLRPMITMRSGFVTYAEDFSGSGLRHYPADTHIYDWLEQKGFQFDVVTDEDLHDEGVDLIKSYDMVMTSSHPEYHTPQTWDAIHAYTQQGGRLMYLGGNGFYWRVAVDAEFPGLVEIRRGEGGIRAWAAEPGEYFNSLDGQYGGLWRRNGRPPQQITGVGFSGQGKFQGTYYRRAKDTSDEQVSWIFDGVDDEILGDFGLSGGGAAGFELDRVDYRLGSPLNTRILASSEEYAEHFVLVPEEQLTHVVTWAHEPKEKLIRADMVYYEMPNDGAIFSVGSITYCGSLSHNNYDNNISRITENVLRRFARLD
ncbi:MAG: N,N-dimethylformamidase large subunit [Gammaproteobacteria bacterium]|nr:N,N-dimethylformamidase large subunit [Gammaproteobacteria bacterium]